MPPETTDTGERLVTLVIPAHNAAGTLDACLRSVAPIRDTPGSRLSEIVVVSDHSTDETEAIARSHGVTVLQSPERGPAAARNTGWRHARTPLVWFVDADCVAQEGVLEPLLAAIDEPGVAGVSGTYSNALPDSLLATLIDEESAVRHARMGRRVNFLATFDVVYTRAAREEVGGFDARYRKAQDAELSFRVVDAGHELAFTRDSVVAHHHPTSLARYLRTQRQQGYWRFFLHTEHAGHATGDSYSSLLDHAQPPVAVLAAALLVVWGVLAIITGTGSTAALVLAGCSIVAVAALAASQLPMTLAILQRMRRPSAFAFVPMSMVRALWRGVGLGQAAAARVLTRR